MSRLSNISPLLLLALGLISFMGKAQTTILGSESAPVVINTYQAVSEVLCDNTNDQDSVILTGLRYGPESFGTGDTVMLHYAQGADINDSDTENKELGDDDQRPGNTGKYALMIIEEVLGDTIKFNNALNPPALTPLQVEIWPLAHDEKAQLVKAKSYRNAEVRGQGLTAYPWDGEKGGILAMIVTGNLTLNADIDLSGCGFRGASDTEVYTPLCSATDTSQYNLGFYLLSNTRGGKKGEGTTRTNFTLLRGRAKNINGGGGGNGRFSGGGGGSNYSAGGKGGAESTFCGEGVDRPMGVGGFDLGRGGGSYYYLNRDESAGPQFDRIFFGGGGGMGTTDISAGRVSSSGGNGGGIVVILADSIDGGDGSHFIRADGNSVTESSNAAGGGGGGGGVIVLEVDGYKNGVNVSAVGGSGGDTNHPSEITGPGGGGGGGIYWIAGTELPSFLDGLNPAFGEGLAGEYTGGISTAATVGGSPGEKSGLETPIKGFVFNPVPDEFWVCDNEIPETIVASMPKGGSGPGTYTYQWVDSSATQNYWNPIDGPRGTAKDLSFTEPLADTTYFRRIVYSGSLPPAVSFRIAVYVHPAITGNLVTAQDGVSQSDEACAGAEAEPFLPQGNPAQGDGENYSFKWIYHDGDGQYVEAEGDPFQAGYTAPGRDAGTYDFARVVYSGACSDTTTSLTLEVHPVLANVDITPIHDTICQNTPAGLLGNTTPTEGKDGDKRYIWESSLQEAGPWSDVGVSNRDYQSGNLGVTTWFRRVALSGVTSTGNDACMDTSNAVEVLVVDPILNNSITSAGETICTSDRPGLLEATLPGGGYNSEYRYHWEWKSESGSWETAGTTFPIDEQNYQPPVMDADGVSYSIRRVVGSGGPLRDACISQSNEVFIEVLPSITNNTIGNDQLKCQGDVLDNLVQSGPLPGGGASEGGSDPSRDYKWEVANFTGDQAPVGGWTQVSGAAGQDLTDDLVLDSDEDYWYRRIIFSGPTGGDGVQVCADTTAAPVHVTIHTAITGYEIDATDSACFQIEKELLGRGARGEADQIPLYQWREVGGSNLPGTGATYSHTFDGLGPYEFERVVSIGACTRVSDPMVITIMQLPGATLSSTLSEVCEGDTPFDVDLNTGAISNYMPPEQWQFYLDDGVNGELPDICFMTDGQIFIHPETMNNAPSSSYTYTLSRIQYETLDGAICVSPAGSSALQGSVPLQVFNRPIPTITRGGAEVDYDSICGSSIGLKVDADHGTLSWYSDHDQYTSYQEQPPDSVRVSIQESKDAWAMERYLVTFRSDAGNCFGTDTVALFFYEQPADAFAGADTTAWLSNSINMSADAATAGIGTWTWEDPHVQVSDIHDPGAHVTGLKKDEENHFTWVITNGVCEKKEDVTIISYSDAWRPEGISPNGDGLNDYFIIRGLAQAKEWTIHFFNSQGGMVREVTNETAGEIDYDPNLITGGLADNEVVVWDGKSRNGNLVPAGTYYYVVYMYIEQEDGSRDEYTEKHWIVVRD